MAADGREDGERPCGGWSGVCVANVGVSVSWACGEGGGARGTDVMFVHEVIKNCPRYWKVALSGMNVSSASLLGAQ